MKISFIKPNKKHIKIIFTDDKLPARISDDGLVISKPKKDEIKNAYQARVFLRSIIRTAKAWKQESLALDCNELSFLPLQDSELLEALAYEFELADYDFCKYKTQKDSCKFVKEVVLTNCEIKNKNQILKQNQEIAKVTNLAREIANTPAEDMSAAVFVSEVKKHSKNLPIKIKVLDEKALKKEKMGAVLAVGQASSRKPKMLIMEYLPVKKAKPTALVGKGVIYDTGGLGLKPAEFMMGMHMDMSGASVVAHTVVALAKSGAKTNVVAAIPLVENAIGEKAYRQGDIVKTRKGLTVEIKHTDAEGRLILADAISYVQDKYKPNQLLDVATLTGACVVALGEYASGVFAREQEDYQSLLKVSDSFGQRLWPLPLYPEFGGDLSSKVADIANIGGGRYGGASVAAAFLEKFVEKNVSWTHIDIAPRMEATSKDALAHGSTGEPLLSLVKYLSEQK